MSVPPITPAQFIRQHVLRMTVTDFAEALRVAPSIVSRYESAAGVIPDKHHGRVHQLAKKKGVQIRPRWFSEVPWDPKARVPA